MPCIHSCVFYDSGQFKKTKGSTACCTCFVYDSHDSVVGVSHKNIHAESHSTGIDSSLGIRIVGCGKRTDINLLRREIAGKVATKKFHQLTSTMHIARACALLISIDEIFL